MAVRKWTLDDFGDVPRYDYPMFVVGSVEHVALIPVSCEQDNPLTTDAYRLVCHQLEQELPRSQFRVVFEDRAESEMCRFFDFKTAYQIVRNTPRLYRVQHVRRLIALNMPDVWRVAQQFFAPCARCGNPCGTVPDVNASFTMEWYAEGTALKNRIIQFRSCKWCFRKLQWKGYQRWQETLDTARQQVGTARSEGKRSRRLRSLLAQTRKALRTGNLEALRSLQTEFAREQSSPD